MSKKLLVKTKYNFADEIELESFCLLKKKEYKTIVAVVKDYFNTNYGDIQLDVPLGDLGESITFWSSDAILDENLMEATYITDEEYNYIKSMFGKRFGICSLANISDAISLEKLSELHNG